jgi:cytochrome c-type biogenesis protein CcmH/NrfF
MSDDEYLCVDDAQKEFIRILRYRVRELAHIIGAQGEVCTTLREEITKYMEEGKDDYTPIIYVLNMYGEVAVDQNRLVLNLIKTIDKLQEVTRKQK